MPKHVEKRFKNMRLENAMRCCTTQSSHSSIEELSVFIIIDLIRLIGSLETQIIETKYANTLCNVQ